MPKSDNYDPVKQNPDLERVRLAMEVTGLGTWDYFPLTGEIIWDDRCREIFGVSKDYKPTLQSFIDILHPDDREKVVPVSREGIKSETSAKYQNEYRVIGLENNISRWIHSTGQAFFDDKGNIVRHIGTVEDITEKVRNTTKYQEAQKEVQHKAHVLETINRIGEVILSQLDKQKVVQIITDEATSISGAEFGAFFYTSVDENDEKFTLYTISGVDRKHFDKFPMPRNTGIFKPTFSGERVVRYDDVTKAKEYGKNPPYHGMPEGHLPVKSYLSVPVLSKRGEVLGGLFFGHSKPGIFLQETEDIVKGIATQAAIALENAELYQKVKSLAHLKEEQKEMLHKILEESPAHITITRGPDHIYTFINKNAREIIGDMELLGKSAKDLPDQNYSDLADYIFNSGETINVREMYLEMDKIFPGDPRTFYFDIVYSPIFDSNGKIEGVVRYANDITEQVKSRHTIENFIGISSHELKTPLTTIISYIDLLKDVIHERNYEPVESFINKLDKNATKLNALISDLLDVTKIRSGKFNINPKPLELQNFIEECIENIQEIFNSHKINLVNEATVMINADAQRLEQAFVNLISNAIKYSPEANEVDVFIKQIKDKVHISITDYGLGIEQDKIPHLFQQFFRISEKHYSGLGMGLFITKEIITLHKGKVELKSDVGKGSTFTIILPVYEPEE